MQITTQALADWFEVRLKGRMDAVWSDHVSRVLAESVQAGHHAISLDMSEVDYISSAGIRILVLYARQLKAIQGSFAVVKPSEPVRKVLELSGLQSLLLGPATVPRAVAQAVTQSISLSPPGATAEVFALEPQGALRVEWPGSPEPWLDGTATSAPGRTLKFPADVMGIGLGRFGSGEREGAAAWGEFLAAAGAIVCLPSDGSTNPDYLLQEGGLIPSLEVAYGMVGRGHFRQLLRFDKGTQAQSLSFSSILHACLQANGGHPTGLVMVAETASLTGVSLRKLPVCPAGQAPPFSPFAFPNVRDWFSFTTEPAYANTTSLVVGYVAGNAETAGLRLLKPLVRCGELLGHFHAAVFPYQPLRKGMVELGNTVRPLFELGQVSGLLHLVNDWREANGAGESRFLRGACWCSPLLL